VQYAILVYMKYTWYKSIPESNSHGTGTYQKRLWKVVSDYVRIRDFYKYKKCISCGKYVDDWKNPDWQAGHYVPYSICKGYTKFNPDNVFGQCSYCNRGFSGAPAGATFKENIVKRNSKKLLAEIERFKYAPLEKREDYTELVLLKQMILKLGELPEQPDYYKKVLEKEEFINF